MAGVTLPEYGFLARVPTEKGPVLATIARRNGTIVELARSPDQMYVNGRQVVDGAEAIEPTVKKFEPLGGRRFRLILRWQADSPIPAGWSPFVHFCDEQGEIVFQGSHQPPHFDRPQQGTLDFPVECAVPANLPAGQTLELRVGLYQREGFGRMWLTGRDDGARRIRLGQIHLNGTGNEVTRITWTPDTDPFRARQNPKNVPIDFGPIVTYGGCRLTAENNALVLTPLPSNKARFEARLRWSALPWPLPKPVSVEAVAEDGHLIDRQPARVENDFIVLDCDPAVFCYRLIGQ